MNAVKDIVKGYIDTVYWLNDDEQEMGMSDAVLSQEAKMPSIKTVNDSLNYPMN